MRFLPWASSSSATSLSFHHWGEDPTSAANSLPGNHHYFHHGPQPHSLNIEKRNSQLYLFSFYPLPPSPQMRPKSKSFALVLDRLPISWYNARFVWIGSIRQNAFHLPSPLLTVQKRRKKKRIAVRTCAFEWFLKFGFFNFFQSLKRKMWDVGSMRQNHDYRGHVCLPN